jgi:hypothetical protein
MNTRRWTISAAVLVVLIGLGTLGFLVLKTMRHRSTVYSNALSGKPGSEWSNRKTDKSKKRGLDYLGKFGRDKVTLSLEGLPEHKLVRVSFDLLLMQSWDGSSKTWGESRWNLDVVDGPNLIQTTFGNCGFFSDNNVQNFPDNRPFGAYPAWTGSIEHQTLGTIQSWGGPDRTFDCSSVYHLVLTFPHSGNNVKLCFQGYKPDKTWGLRNVQVDALPNFAAYSPAEFASLWEKLADNDPLVAFKAKWDLIAGGPSTVAFLADTLSAPGTSSNNSPESADALRLHRTRELLQVINTPDADDLVNKLDGQAAAPK